MKAFPTCVPLISTCIAASAQTSDFKGHKEPARFTRMPRYFLPAEGSVIDKAFDAFEFQLKDGTQRAEGRHPHCVYRFDDAAGNMPGILQIVRSYEAAATCPEGAGFGRTARSVRFDFAACRAKFGRVLSPRAAGAAGQAGVQFSADELGRTL
jgi:hypothetical protein